MEEGGLNMVDIESFFNSLQARWIDRIVESKENWAYIENKLIDNYAPHKLLLKTSELKNDYIQTLPDFYLFFSKLQTCSANQVFRDRTGRHIIKVWTYPL